MTKAFSTLKLTAVSLCLAGGLVLPGCYKADMEAQKARADKAEGDLKAVGDQLAKAKADLDRANGQLAASKRGVLITLVNGQQSGTDEIAMTNNPGQFVRNGRRTRQGSSVMFEAGRIVDQELTTLRDNGKPNFKGMVKGGRPDGEWLWYTPAGIPATKEVWKEGKLSQVFDASSVKGDVITWKERTKAGKEQWFNSTRAVFNNLPELVRELDVAPPAPKPDASKPGDANKPDASKPGDKTKPATPPKTKR